MPTKRRADLEKRRQQKQKRSLAWTIGGAAVLIVGGLITIFVLNQRQSGGSIPLGATVIPQNAILSLTVPTDEGPWQKFGAFGTPETQKQWQTQLKGFETEFLEPFGLNYAKNVRSWVGPQITLAHLSPAAEDAAKVGGTATVWFLPLRDAQQAESTLGKMTSTSGGTQKRTYKDVEVQTVQGKDGKLLSTAILEKRMLVATNGNLTLNQIIDTYRGAPSLAQTPRLSEAMATIENRDAFAQLYVNLPLAAAGLLQDASRSVSAATVERIQAVQGLGATITLQDDGLNFKAISWLKPNTKIELKGSNNAQTLAQLMPADTLATTSGADFQQAWQDYSQGSEAQLVVPLNPSKIQSGLQQSTGIDFEKEFVTWMNGEFVTALVPTTDKNKQGVGLVLLAKASDRTKADQSFQKLDTAMRDRHNFLIAQSKVGSRAVTTWKVPPNLPLASHGWLDNNVAFFTFGAPITDRILTPAKSPLVNTDLFKAVTTSSLKSNGGQFYIDILRTATLMQNSPLLPKLSPTNLQFAQAMNGIGLTSSVQNPWSTRYDLVVKLKR